jgi:hypothetical protein
MGGVILSAAARRLETERLETDWNTVDYTLTLKRSQRAAQRRALPMFPVGL